jgi:ferredoxin
MTLNGSAESLTRYGFARPVGVAEGLAPLQQANEHNLVQFGENVRQGVNFICHCCCEAMTLVSTNDPHHPNRKRAKVHEELCLDCGDCARSCSTHCITLRSRPQRVITPLNSAHRVVVMAVERGKLQHLICDGQVLWSQRALAAVLGVILKLPPLKQAMASQQMKSHYLETLISRMSF